MPAKTRNGKDPASDDDDSSDVPKRGAKNLLVYSAQLPMLDKHNFSTFKKDLEDLVYRLG